MSQNDFSIANQTFPNTRSDLNDALQALASLSSGSTAPSTTYANMLWYDTTNNILKMRTEADDAWISLAYIDQSSNAFRIFDDTQVVNTSGTQTGLLGDQTTATWETGTGTTESLVSPAKVKAAVAALGESIGRSQSWSDVSGSRSLGTSYQNTTGKPIAVSIYLDSVSADRQFQISSNGSTWITLSRARDDGNERRGVFFGIVPDDHYYRVNSSGSATLVYWAELR